MTGRQAHFIVIAGTLLAVQTATAARIDGRVESTDGKAIRAALVTLVRADGLYSETVYSNDDGRFHLDTRLAGKLSLRARAPGFADGEQTIDVGVAGPKVAFELRRLTTPREISDSLPASAQFTRLKFASETERQNFQNDCLSCHQMGSELTRMVRPADAWTATVERMLSYSGNSNSETLAEYVKLLATGFDGQPHVVAEEHDVAPQVLKARITEWKLPGAQIAHDTEVNPRDGRFYTVDGVTDYVYITDPASNRTEGVPVPAMDVPFGGKFAAQGMPIPIGMTGSRHGPHSIQYGPDGRFYITSALGGYITAFDPAARTFQDYPVGSDAFWPHTIRFDAQGIAWFTIAISNQVGRFDPKSGAMKTIDLPKTTARPDAGFMFPYGVDVSPLDGSIWYTRLWARKVGRIDPETLAVKEFDPPLSGPRRLRFDASGNLWIPAFGDGALVKLDTRTMNYTTYTLPRLSPGESEAPYAVAVDPKRQDVWVTSNMSDRLFRFLPKEERFITYPLPTRGTYTREFFFPADGRVCSPASPLPAAPSVIEGGMDAIVCLDLGAKPEPPRFAVPAG
jgi:DNA-binding beta-propeller fold protein YncE